MERKKWKNGKKSLEKSEKKLEKLRERVRGKLFGVRSSEAVSGLNLCHPVM